MFVSMKASIDEVDESEQYFVEHSHPKFEQVISLYCHFKSRKSTVPTRLKICEAPPLFPPAAYHRLYRGINTILAASKTSPAKQKARSSRRSRTRQLFMKESIDNVDDSEHLFVEHSHTNLSK